MSLYDTHIHTDCPQLEGGTREYSRHDTCSSRGGSGVGPASRTAVPCLTGFCLSGVRATSTVGTAAVLVQYLVKGSVSSEYKTRAQLLLCTNFVTFAPKSCRFAQKVVVERVIHLYMTAEQCLAAAVLRAELKTTFLWRLGGYSSMRWHQNQQQ